MLAVDHPGMVATALGPGRALSPDELIERHMGYARTLARRLAYRLPATVDVEELESDAYLGLMMAARTFDPDRGVQFRTYAAPRVLGQMLDGLRERTGCRRRHRGPNCVSLDTAVADGEGHATPLVATLAAEMPPVGHEIEAADEVRHLLRRLDIGSRRHLTDHHLKGLRQYELAERAGITASAMSLRMKKVRELALELIQDLSREPAREGRCRCGR